MLKLVHISNILYILTGSLLVENHNLIMIIDLNLKKHLKTG